MIPKILHMIWIGPKPFPFSKNLERYVELHPEWEVKLWTDSNLPKIRNRKIYKSIPIYAAKADLLRIEILALYGGIYVDADSYPVKPLDELIENLHDCFVTTNSKGRIEINLMGCSRDNKKIQDLVAGVKEYWRKLGEKESKHDCYCIYRYIKRRLKKLKCVKLEREYNCTAKEATEDTFIIQEMANSWQDNKHFVREKL